MAAAVILKITKSRYIRNSLTDLYEIWYDDAKCLLTAVTVKKVEFHKSKMADGRHFENR